MLTTIQGVIADELQAYEYVTWFTSSYLVAMSSIVPITGRLSYIVSPRILMFGSTLFVAAGMLISALAHSLTVFLIGRAVAGIGAAGIGSVAIVLVVLLTPIGRRGLAIGLVNTGFTFGVAAGAIIAGALESQIGWRALFWLQSPISVACGMGLLFSIPPDLSAQRPGRENIKKSALQKAMNIDYVGAVLLIISIVSLLYGLSTPKITIIPIVASFLIFPIFLYQEIYRHPDPIIPVSILASRPALLCCVATLGLMMARWAVLFYTPIFAAGVKGWAPAKAGSILIPTNTGFAVGSLLSGAIHIRQAGSWYIASLVSFAIFPVTLVLLAIACTPLSPTWLIVICTFFNGACAGAAVNYTLHHSLFLVRPDVRFIITSLLATFRGFAGTFGSAIGGGIFTRTLQRTLESGFAEHGLKGREELIRRLLGSPRAVQGLEGAEKEVAVLAYTKAVQGLFFAGVVLSLTMLLVQAGTAWSEPPVLDEVLDGDRPRNRDGYEDEIET